MSENHVDVRRRRFLTNVTTGVGVVGMVGAAVPFVASMMPSDRARAAGAPTEVDISKLMPGQMLTVEWRGKPVYIVNRTDSMLATLDELTSTVSDPDSEKSDQPDYAQNPERSLKPELLVILGVCTHLGCAPLEKLQVGAASGLGADWQGGFFCPCHGSKFDIAGRVYKGVPAPTNLPVPPYSVTDGGQLIIGVNPGESV